jgi:hypothetical protein
MTVRSMGVWFPWHSTTLGGLGKARREPHRRAPFAAPVPPRNVAAI